MRTVFGADRFFFRDATDDAFAVDPLWNNDDFDFRSGAVGFSLESNGPTLGPLDGTVAPGSCRGRFALLELKETLPIDIPLSLLGDEKTFTLQSSPSFGHVQPPRRRFAERVARRRRPARSYATPWRLAAWSGSSRG